jgi:translation initiation factor 3 subunit F
VLHSETDEQVAVDMEYHRTMFELHHKVNPKEAIVGWCVALSSLPSLRISTVKTSY